jgi:hypothetical protein
MLRPKSATIPAGKMLKAIGTLEPGTRYQGGTVKLDMQSMTMSRPTKAAEELYVVQEPDIWHIYVKPDIVCEIVHNKGVSRL